jgi:hypothetical protein
MTSSTAWRSRSHDWTISGSTDVREQHTEDVMLVCMLLGLSFTLRRKLLGAGALPIGSRRHRGASPIARFLGTTLQRSVSRRWLFVLIYTLTPLSTTALLMAAGMTTFKSSAYHHALCDCAVHSGDDCRQRQGCDQATDVSDTIIAAHRGCGRYRPIPRKSPPASCIRCRCGSMWAHAVDAASRGSDGKRR